MADSEQRQLHELIPDFEDYLRSNTIRDNFHFTKPHILSSEINPLDAFKKLIEWKIRVAPVFDEKKSEIIGLLDLRDAVKYITTRQRDKEAADKEITLVQKAKRSFTVDLLDQHPEFSSLSIAYLARSRRVPVLHLDKATLLDAATLLHQGNHIVLVQNSDELAGFITQGMLFRLICDHLCDVCGSLTIEDLRSLNVVKENPTVILHDTPAIEAFGEMEKRNYGCIGIIDEDGTIVNSTSARDIKVWLGNLEEKVHSTPIIDIMTKIRQEGAAVKDRFPVASCRYEHKISGALKRLKACRYHRLWVVDEDRKPVGIFSLTDIFRLITGQLEHTEG